MSDNQQDNKSGWTSNGSGRFIAIVAGVGIIAGSIFAVQAFAQSKTYAHVRLMADDDSGMGAGNQVYFASWRGGRGHGRFADMSDTEIEAKITRLVKHAAIEIDATPQQEAQIIALVTPAAINMKSMRGDMKATGEALQLLLAAPVIDREAIEELRLEKLADADRISKEWVDVVADVAMVLTVEQRQGLEERLEQFRSMRRGWRHR